MILDELLQDFSQLQDKDVAIHAPTMLRSVDYFGVPEDCKFVRKLIRHYFAKRILDMNLDYHWFYMLIDDEVEILPTYLNYFLYKIKRVTKRGKLEEICAKYDNIDLAEYRVVAFYYYSTEEWNLIENLMDIVKFFKPKPTKKLKKQVVDYSELLAKLEAIQILDPSSKLSPLSLILNDVEKLSNNLLEAEEYLVDCELNLTDKLKEVLKQISAVVKRIDASEVDAILDKLRSNKPELNFSNAMIKFVDVIADEEDWNDDEEEDDWDDDEEEDDDLDAEDDEDDSDEDEHKVPNHLLSLILDILSSTEVALFFKSTKKEIAIALQDELAYHFDIELKQLRVSAKCKPKKRKIRR